MNQLHDVRSAAAILAISPWTVRAHIRKGTLNPIRIGRLVRLDESELQRFVASAKAPQRFENEGSSSAENVRSAQ